VIIGATLAYYIRRKVNFLVSQVVQATKKSSRIVWESPAIQRLVPTGTALPPPGVWSLDSYALTWLVAEIEQRRPACVVELGAGTSTIILGLKLKALRCGRLVAVEHDEAYAEPTRRWLAFHGLDDIVELRVAPLRSRPGSPNGAPWYEESAFEDLRDVDMLSVDGPPMTVHERVREPALAFFQPRFAHDWVLYLDDADRRGELAFVADWSAAKPDLKIDRLPFPKGAIVVRPTSPSPNTP